MQETLNKLVQSIFQKDSIADCSVHELRSLTNRYPYFSPAYLLLIQKLKQENNPAYSKEVEKAFLFINNPLWLNFLMNAPEKKAIATAILPAMVQEEKPFEDFTNDELVVENPRHSLPQVVAEHALTEEPSSTVVAKEKIKAEQSAFTFEPYHTVDYFASQGIKIVLEEKPTDRFGLQLKSFTDWLKTIRQMPSQEIAKLADGLSEENVVQLAVHSIENREVVTETMAEVWIKQGHPEKAIEVYSKLSLLNPSKSSYFAGLIENLKKN